MFVTFLRSSPTYQATHVTKFQVGAQAPTQVCTHIIGYTIAISTCVATFPPLKISIRKTARELKTSALTSAARYFRSSFRSYLPSTKSRVMRVLDNHDRKHLGID